MSVNESLELTDDEPPVSGARRRRLLLWGVLAVVSVLALGLGFVALSPPKGDAPSAAGAQEDVDDPGDEATEAPEPELDADESVGAEAALTTTFEVYLARDPFEPVRQPEPAGTEPGDAPPGEADDGSPGEDSDLPDSDAPRDPGAPPPPSDPDDPAAPPSQRQCTGGEEERVCDGRVVSLLDLTGSGGERVAEIQVDTTIYTVRENEVFATHFQLVGFDGEDCVMLTFGSETSSLCLGESSLK